MQLTFSASSAVNSCIRINRRPRTFDCDPVFTYHANMTAEAILRMEGVSKSFSGVQALYGVSLSVPEGAVWGLIGPNGAGKTTLLNVINRVLEPDEGNLFFGAARLNDFRVYHLAKLGISRTFQVPRVFRRMSVWDNMLAPTVAVKEDYSVQKKRIDELLHFVGLAGKREQYAHELSGGQQKLLEFARALVTDPALILMDEPFAGVNPGIKAQLIDLIKEMNGRGKTFILVSHDMRSVSDLCPQVTVLNFGLKLTEGPTDKVFSDERVIEAYLGE